jgi:hypothetical protein
MAFADWRIDTLRAVRSRDAPGGSCMRCKIHASSSSESATTGLRREWFTRLTGNPSLPNVGRCAHHTVRWLASSFQPVRITGVSYSLPQGKHLRAYNKQPTHFSGKFGITVSCAEKRGQMPSSSICSKLRLENARRKIVCTQETLRCSREVLRISREAQADRGRLTEKEAD